MRPAFIKLDQLCKDWAAQSGEPVESVLSLLCAHSKAGAFTPWAFQHLPTGHYLGSGALDKICTQIQSNNVAAQQDAFHALAEINASTEHIMTFCKQTKTRPPPSVTGSDGRFQWLDSQHLAPPALGTPIPKSQSHRRGRRKGSGSYAKADEPLIEEMNTLIQSGEAASEHDAAKKVVDGAIGGGTTESKVRRLTDRYKKKYRSI